MKFITRQEEREVMSRDFWVFKFHLVCVRSGEVYGLVFNKNFNYWATGLDVCKLLNASVPSYGVFAGTKRGCLDFANSQGFVLQTKKQRREKDLCAENAQKLLLNE